MSLALFTLIPLLVTGRDPIAYTMDWIRTLGTASGGVNDPSPFNFISAWLVNIQVLVYCLLNAQSTVTTLVSWGIIGLISLVAYYWIWRTRQSASDDTYVLDFALLSSLSLAMIYHRQYDMFLMFPGLVYPYVTITRLKKRSAQRAWAVFLLVILIILTLPGDTLIGVVASHLELHDNYLLRVILPFQGWSNVALLGALLWLKYAQVRQVQPAVQPTVAEPLVAG